MQPQFLFYAAAIVVGAVLFEAREQPPEGREQETTTNEEVEKSATSAPSTNQPPGHADAEQKKEAGSEGDTAGNQNTQPAETNSQRSDEGSDGDDGSDDESQEVAAKPLTPEELAAQEQILKLGEKFVLGYEKGDHASLGALFTEDAEYVDEDGNVVQGRAAIEASLKEFFAEHPECRLEVAIESLRFPGPAVAVEDGATRVTHIHRPQAGKSESRSEGPSSPDTVKSSAETTSSPVPASSSDGPGDSNGITANAETTEDAGDVFGTQVECRYTAVYVNVGGEWRIASIRDFPHENRREHQSRLEDLAWLTGEWLDEGDDSVIHFSCRPTENGHFLLRDFTIVIDGQESMRGTQRIGWDPIARKLRAWIFDSDGGFADGFWYQNGNDWVLKCNGVTADGESASGSMIYTHVNDHIMQWQMVDHEVNGVPLPDSEVFTIVRTAPSPAPELAEDSK